MSFLLKIVAGPNNGAEIALVEGVAITLGKNDDCDIVLADGTLGNAPIKIETTANDVVFDGETLQPYHVKEIGATALAIGPAEGAWQPLVWPKTQTTEEPAKPEPKPAEEPKKAPEEPKEEKKRSSGCMGCLVAIVLLLLGIAAALWFFRERVKTEWHERVSGNKEQDADAPTPAQTLESIAEKYSLTLTQSDDSMALSGNLTTRRARLAATGEAYAAFPGISLDLTDDESFKAAAEDELFTLTEGSLKVTSLTNRILTITGNAASPLALKKTLEALAADLPKLRDIDVKGVRIGGMIASSDDDEVQDDDESYFAQEIAKTTKRTHLKQDTLQLPVCGILTSPYPCLVMRNGSRIMEGASIEGWTINKISADSITLSNATGSVVWKP